jgi:hypothetical protein
MKYKFNKASIILIILFFILLGIYLLHGARIFREGMDDKTSNTAVSTFQLGDIVKIRKTLDSEVYSDRMARLEDHVAGFMTQEEWNKKKKL